MPQTTSKGSRSRDLVSAGSELLSPYRAKRNVVINQSLGSVFRWTASITGGLFGFQLEKWILASILSMKKIIVDRLPRCELMRLSEMGK